MEFENGIAEFFIDFRTFSFEDAMQLSFLEVEKYQKKGFLPCEFIELKGISCFVSEESSLSWSLVCTQYTRFLYHQFKTLNMTEH